MRAGVQVATVLRFAARDWLNSLRRRQGAGAMVIFPLLLVFLLVELARFGARASQGMARVLRVTAPARGAHYAAFWLCVLVVAIAALKYARLVPGRGARRVFDTALFRALPVAPTTRVVCELAVGSSHAAGFLLLVLVPAVWGVARSAHASRVAVGITAGAVLVVNVATTGAAYALHEVVTRRVGGRGLDVARALAATLGFGLVGVFAALGPIAAGGARTLVGSGVAPAWGAYLPTRPFVAWVLGHAAGVGAAWRAFAPPVVLVALSLGLVAWRSREPLDLALDAPREVRGPRRWEVSLGAWRAELRMVLRQAPYVLLAAPAFVGFFALLAHGARRATGAEMPLIALFGLTGWAVVVLGTALSGAAARRWRRVLWVPLAAGCDHRAALRGVALAHTALAAGLTSSVFVLLLQERVPGPWWFVRVLLGVAAAIGVGQWVQAGAVFLMIDPAPDRLTGLSVGALFGVLFAAVPAAALVLLVSAVPLALWVSLASLYGLYGWAIERAAVERLRWIRDPAGDPAAELRAWPALRAFGVAMVAQVLAMALCEQVLGLAFPPRVVAGYVVFAAVVIPLAQAARGGFGLRARWGRARAVAVGVLVGACQFGLASGYARWAGGRFGGGGGALARALRDATLPVTVGLVLTAVVLGPVAEELFFRGWLQQALRRDLPPRVARGAFVLTAAVFAVMHASEAWLPALAGGLVAGWLMDASGRMETSVALHVTNNALVMATALVERGA